MAENKYKPLFLLAAEERLKGQPPRHAKVYKDDISVFEADMLYVMNYLLTHEDHSLGAISKATGIPKATLRKLLSPYGIKRIYDKNKLENLRKRNLKRYIRVITEYNSIIKDEKGKWKALEYREKDFERFRAWLMERGYFLVVGKNKYLLLPIPEDIKEETLALYTYRIEKGGYP